MAFQGDSIFWVEVEKIVPNPFQPRREFDERKLKELADSVRMYGILQPLTVTRKEVSREDGTFYSEYELIAGERRLRASKLAGLAQVPVIIRDGEQSEQEKLELAIIENLQREDLNAVDRGLAFRQLADAFGLSHAQVAQKVGRSREYVSNTLRLLLLPDYMLDSLKVGDLSEGHARTLLMLNDRQEEQDTVYREILLKKLSVREVERIARKIATDKVRKKKWQNSDPGLIEIEKQFTESLGTRVQIAKTDYGGKISIDYFSDEDLTTILERLKKETEEKKPMKENVVMAVTDEMEDLNAEERDILDRMAYSTALEFVDTNEVQDEEANNQPTAANVTPEVAAKDSVPENAPESVSEVREAAEVPVERQVMAEVTPEVQEKEFELENTPEPTLTGKELAEAPVEQVESDAEQQQREPENYRPPMMSEESPEPSAEEKTVASSAPETHPPFMTSEDVVKKEEKEKEEDESDMYSIRNFEV